MREELATFVRCTAPLGFEYLRVEAGRASTIIYGADGIDKSVFVKATTKRPVKNLDGSFALGDLPLFANLIIDSEFQTEGASVRLLKRDVDVFRKVDPDDDDSETVSEVEERPSEVVFTDANGHVTSFRLGNVAMAPKAQLKSEPEWTTKFDMTFKDSKLALFRQRASQFKSVVDKFRARVVVSDSDPNTSYLQLTLGEDGGHNTYVNLAKFETSAKFSVGKHAWPLDKVLPILSLTKDCEKFTVGISKDTGLMKIEFEAYIGTKLDDKGKLCIDTDGDLECDNKITFVFIVPGKIAD